LEESIAHLLSDCNFAETTWAIFAETYNLPSYQVMAAAGGHEKWSSLLLKMGPKEKRRKTSGMCSHSGGSYGKRGIKEYLNSLNPSLSNKRIFEFIESFPQQVTSWMKEAIALLYITNQI
jgi:hypothetical protein